MIAEGATAIDPKTGHRVILKGGKWVDLNSPQTQAQLPDADQEQLKNLTADFSEKQLLAQRANEFMQLNKKTGTGPGYAGFDLPHWLGGGEINPGRFLANIGQAAGLTDAGSNLQQMESVGNQTWVNMRPAGSGQMRMPEVQGFKQAFPNVENFGPANQAIAERLNAEAQQAAHRLNFVQDFIRSGKGNVTNALAAWGSMTGNAAPPSPGQPPPAPPGGAPPAGSSSPPASGGAVFHYDAMGNRQ